MNCETAPGTPITSQAIANVTRAAIRQQAAGEVRNAYASRAKARSAGQE